MSLEIGGFSHDFLQQGPSITALVSGKGFDLDTQEVGFVDETGRVISGCKFVDAEDKGEVVEFGKEILVKSNSDDSNDESLEIIISLTEDIRAKKVRVFVKKTALELPRCVAIGQGDGFFVYQKWIRILQ